MKILNKVEFVAVFPGCKSYDTVNRVSYFILTQVFNRVPAMGASIGKAKN